MPWFLPASAPSGHLDFGGWLGTDLLWLNGWVDREPSESVRLRWSGAAAGSSVEAARFRYRRPELERFPGALGQVVVLRVDPAMSGRSTLDEVWLGIDGREVRWSRRRGIGLSADLVTLFEHLLPSMDAGEAERLHAFLGTTVGGIGRDEDPLLARNLATVERLGRFLGWSVFQGEETEEGTSDEEVATAEGVAHEAPAERVATVSVEPPPPFVGSPAEPFGMCIDRALRVDEHRLFLSGWMFDFEDSVRSLTLAGPGFRSPVELQRIDRAEISENFRPHFGEPAVGRHGFLTLVEAEPPIDDPRTCVLEVGFEGGRTLGLGLPPGPTGPRVVRDLVFQSLAVTQRVEERVLTPMLFPTLEVLSDRCRRLSPAFDESVFGVGTDQPTTSLVVTVGGNPNILWTQLACFGGDRDLESTEILYVLGDPEHREFVEHQIYHASRLDLLPRIRLIAASEAIGSAAAVNLGVQLARGEVVMLVHSDVFPDRRGWSSPLASAVRDAERPTIVSPVLLGRLGSIQHAGVEFADDVGPDRLWTALDRWKGLPWTDSRRQSTGPVAAVRDGVLAFRRHWFEEVGGYRDSYVAGDDEDLDFCLRALEAGGAVRCLPDHPLVHLEAQTKQMGSGWARSDWGHLYNRFLLSQRWGERLASGDVGTRWAS